MRPDLELVKQILIAVEDLPPDPDWEPLHLDGYDDVMVNEHVRIMAKKGLIEAKDTSTLAGLEFCPIALTFEGGELLDALRDNAKWEKAKALLLETGRISLPVLLSRLIELLT